MNKYFGIKFESIQYLIFNLNILYLQTKSQNTELLLSKNLF